MVVVREVLLLMQTDASFATLREVYYELKNYFSNQAQCSRTIQKLANILGTFRFCLGIVASSRGLFAGHVYFRDGASLQWTKAVSPDEHFVGLPLTPAALGERNRGGLFFRHTSLRARCILVVEKEAVFQRLVNSRFYDRYPCVILTGKGQPSFAARAYVRKLRDHLQIPVLLLVDWNPWGLRIALTYMSGGSSCPEGYHYAVPSARIVGIMKRHVEAGGDNGETMARIRPECFQDFRPSDLAVARSLLSNTFLRNEKPHLISEVRFMMQRRETLEIEALYSEIGIEAFLRAWLPGELVHAIRSASHSRR